MVFMILYALLVTKSRRADRREKKKTGYIFLEENTPPGHQLYAVVVDTGFRAPARFTAKVTGCPGRHTWSVDRRGRCAGTARDSAICLVTRRYWPVFLLGGLARPSLSPEAPVVPPPSLWTATQSDSSPSGTLRL